MPTANNPFPYFPEAGTGGFIYIGTANLDAQTNPITVYRDAGLTIASAQPIRTVDGYPAFQGAQSGIYTSAGAFSITVKDANGVVQASAPSVSTFTDAATLAGTGGAALIGKSGGGTVQDAINTIPSSGVTGAGMVGFSQSSTYPIATVGDHLKRFICVTDAPYNAKGDGTTDDTAAIAAAVAAVIAAGGGVLWFPEGTYKVSSAVTISAPMTLLGMGATISTTSASATIFTLTAASSNPGVIIDGLRFATTATRTASQYIDSASANGTKIRRCRFDNAYDAIAVTGGVVEGFEVSSCYFYATNRVCVNITASTGSQGITTSFIQDNTFLGADPANQTVVAIQIACVGDLTIRHNSSLYCSAAISTPAVSGKTVQALKIFDNWFDSGSASAININPSGGIIYMTSISRNWIATFTSAGIVAAGTGTIGTISITDNEIGNNGGNGIHIASTIVAETDIRGNKIGDCGGSGVVTVANLNKFKIISNTFGATGQWSTNAAYDVLINAGTSDYYIVTQNFSSPGGTGNISDGGTGVNKTVSGNFTV